MPWRTIMLIAGSVFACGVLVLGLFSLLSRRPNNLGPIEGRLAPCPESPNCVCSQATDEAHRVAPLAFSGNPDQALDRARAIVSSWPRTRVVTASNGYVHAECRSLIFRFVDDLELLLDREAKVIHVRSASRAGRSDLGVNRRRVEALRRAFAALE